MKCVNWRDILLLIYNILIKIKEALSQESILKLTPKERETTLFNLEAGLGFFEICFLRPGVFTRSIKGLKRT